MKPLRFAQLALTPTIASLSGCLGLSALVVTSSALTYTLRSGVLFDLLFGADSSIELIEQSRVTFSAFNNNIFGNPLLNKVLFFGFWMAIGLVAYLIISGVGQGIGSADAAARELRQKSAYQKRVRSDFRARALVRLAVGGLWLVYTALFFKFFLPFSVLSGRIAGANLTEPIGWLYGLAGLGVLVLSLHFHVVMARLFALKPRLGTNADDIVMSQVRTHKH